MNTRMHTDLTITINLAAQGTNSPLSGQPPVTLVQQVTLLDPTGKQIAQTQTALPVIADDITDVRLADINAALAQVGLVATRAV